MPEARAGLRHEEGNCVQNTRNKLYGGGGGQTPKPQSPPTISGWCLSHQRVSAGSHGAREPTSAVHTG